MESLFQPVVKDLLGLVHTQAKLAKRKANHSVDVSKNIPTVVF
jgi:hypothetical protein